jgi:hypothetical protein
MFLEKKAKKPINQENVPPDNTMLLHVVANIIVSISSFSTTNSLYFSIKL